MTIGGLAGGAIESSATKGVKEAIGVRKALLIALASDRESDSDQIAYLSAV